ncbi:MAG: hypothetical protein ABEI76_11515 [Halobacteriales archaeon]
MPHHSKITVAVVLLVGVSVLVGTGAFTAVSADRTATVSVVGDSRALLQLDPHGSGGEATLVDGQLTLGELNIDATTDYRDGVFTITNQGTQPVGVWITDRDTNGVNYTSKITFYNETFGGGAAVTGGTTAQACENGVASIERRANAVQLGVGETLLVQLKVVTAGVASADADVLTGMTIHASANVAGVSAPTGVSCGGTATDEDADSPDGVDIIRDRDGDTMDDKTEQAIGTDPRNADTDGDGISDTIETSKSNGVGPGYEIDTDGDGAIDATDTDADGDSIPDSIEGTGDADDDGISNYRDLDSDGDGASDSEEGTGDADGDGTPNYLDSATEPGPPGGLAYADADDDLEYDPGETTYTASQLVDFDEDVNLVIPADVNSGKLSAPKIEIKARKITAFIDLETTTGKLELKADADDGTVTVDDVELTAQRKLELEATTISAETAVLTSVTGKIELEAEEDDGGPVTLSNSELTAENEVSVKGTTIGARNTTITSVTDKIELKAETDDGGPVVVDNATLTAPEAVLILGTEVNARTAAVTADDGPIELYATVDDGGPIDVVDSEITAHEDLELIGTTIDDRNAVLVSTTGEINRSQP